jgi:acetyl-CoA acetyltransferase
MTGERSLQVVNVEIDAGDRYAICTMCIGVGQGIAMLIEKP